MNSENDAPIWQEIPAALLVPAACVGFTRVFVEASATVPIIAAALLSSAVAVVARRTRLPLALAALISILLLSMLVLKRYAGDSLQFGIIPTGETPGVVGELVADLLSKFREVVSPVDSHPSFIAAAIVGAWIMSFLTDWGAMRLKLAFEPVLPAALLFVFTSIEPINAGQNRLLSTVVFACAVAAWAVVQRAASLFQRGVWLANDGQRGPASVGKAGAVVALVAVLVGATVGGRLPGADAEAVWRLAEEQSEAREVTSPFVRIRERLDEQTNVELFTVTASQPTYWRMAGLDDYVHYDPNDGELKASWQVRASFDSVDGSLPSKTDLGGSRDLIEQTFDMKALGAIWLPAAYAPTDLIDSTYPVTWNPENSTLSVPNGKTFSDGVRYSIVSSIPSYTVDELRSAPESMPDEIRERFTQLPERIPPEVEALARQTVEGQTTRYDKAKALQDHFRSYEYSIDNIRNGNQDPFLQFLEERSGYCQDFSGTFAVMARMLGIPARVATGFTWGEPIGTDAAGQTTYSVTGRQAHAWPEVYFDQLGWVPFEPTPGRGLPEAVEYTGAEARQASAQASDAVPTTTPPTTIAENEPGLGPLPTTIPPTDEVTETQEPQPVPVEEESRSLPQVLWNWFVNLPWRWLMLALVVIAYIVGVPLIQKARRQQRRAAAKDDADKVETAWAEATESLELGFDIRRSSSETRKEFAERLTGDPRVPGQALDELAGATTIARFHPTGVTSVQADAALHRADEIESTMRQRVPKLTLLSRQLNPKRLLRPTGRATHPRQAITAMTSQNTRKASEDNELTNV